jgi:antitoxin ParD1/3/4
MARQSFTVTEKNDEWLKKQVNSKENISKSELVNDLIRQARNQQKEIYWIPAKLDRAEKSGFYNRNPEEN